VVSEMSDAGQIVRYTEYHPRWYRFQVSTWWWVARWPYLKFILREISSVFVAWFVVVLLLEIRALSRGPEAYAGLERWLQNPLIVLLNLITLFFVIFHAITWFNVAPRAMAIRLRGRRVPDLWIVGTNYVSWAAISLLVVWLLVRS
jgi:fumarate reductase subunit C